MPGRIAVLCTLDTKGEHARFVGERIAARGHLPVYLDIGVLDAPAFAPDVSRSEIAAAAGGEVAELARSHDRGKALDVMSRGAAAVVGRLHAAGALDGVLGIGGGSGTAVATAAMRALPVGVPKLMVSTMAASGKAASYVGTRDIVMSNTITDVVGMNDLLRSVLSNAAGAICGMVEMGSSPVAARGEARRAVAITAFGVTTPAVLRCRDLLADAGFETLVFHANGTGGRAMEELVAQGVIDAVLDLTTTELADELCGGLLSAGATRLDAAGARALPQVVLPGAMDMVNFATPDTVPQRYAGRRLYRHSPNTTLMRTSVAENAALGRCVGAKLARARRRPALVLPTRGFSEYDREGGVFWDPDADAAFMDAAVEALGGAGSVIRVDANVNDLACVDVAVEQLLQACAEAWRG